MAHVSEVPAGRIFRPDEQQVLRVAAYCRVSTEHEEQETSLEMQEAHREKSKLEKCRYFF